jgi:regulator of cell morphogenesis and NO signaling
MTVGQLVAEQPARSRVFERLGIDYCCGGGDALSDACTAKDLDLGVVLKDLEDCDASAPAQDEDWTRASLTALCDHIERAHHGYLRAELPRLDALTEKVVRAHGDTDARLQEVRGVFCGLRAELEAHLAKEELILFPLIRQMDGASIRPRFRCGSVQNPIRVMIAEHDGAGEALGRLRSLTGDYAAPPTACNTYRAMLEALAALELDLHLHIHKENSVLFPRAEALEAALPCVA